MLCDRLRIESTQINISKIKEKKNMVLAKTLQSLKRGSYITLALSMLGVWAAADFLLLQQHAAALQFGARKLTVSSSASGTVDLGNRGSGSNGMYTKHTFDFTPGSSATVGSIKLEYCTTPLPDTTCTAPTGMDASTVTTIAGTDSTGWSLGTGGDAPTASVIKITQTPAAFTNTSKNFTFGNGVGNSSTDYIKNPTTENQTFFVRISTYSDTAWTTRVDVGTVANSTAQQIDITAKVQEVLNFSVGTVPVAPSTNCAPLNDVTDTYALKLGNNPDGVLDFSTAYDNHSYFRVSTNANGGSVISYSGDTLKSGANDINAIGTTATASATGTEQFGLAVDSSDLQSGNGYSFTNLAAATAPTDYSQGSGTITNAGTALFAFDPTSITTPVPLATTASTIVCDTGSVRYLGNISTTTPPGIYTTSITYIATPTY